MGEELISSGGICLAISSLFNFYKQSEPKTSKRKH